MSKLSSLMAARFAAWDGEPQLEQDVFGTADPDAIVGMIDGFCRQHLAAGVVGYEFFATSVGSVHGVRLDDGRRVVVKAHRPQVNIDHLAAVQQVQRTLADGGFPAPVPLLGPVPLGHGVAVVESLLDRGAAADAHEAAVRRTVAAGLWRIIELSARLAGLPGLAGWRDCHDRLWREPHDARFDFAATSAGAGWIDQLAAKAVSVLDTHAAGPPVVGHGDWRVEHLRFDRGELTATYDWDSVSAGPEPLFVGAAAHAFTADWTTDRADQLPSHAESLAFIDDYQDARGRTFDGDELRAARAALVATMAYTARCQLSDMLTDFGTHPARRQVPAREMSAGGCIELLGRHGEDLLEPA